MRQNKIFSYLAIFSFIIVFFAYCGPQEAIEEPQMIEEDLEAVQQAEMEKTPQEILVEMMTLDEGMDRDKWKPAMKSLADALLIFQKDTLEKSKAGDFQGVAELFGDEVSFTIWDYTRVKGVKNLVEAVAKEKKAKFYWKVRIEGIFITDVLGEREFMVNEEKVVYDGIAYIFGVVHVIVEEEPGIMQNQSFPFMGCRPHRDDCFWPPGTC
jgi:hypothetical protein